MTQLSNLSFKDQSDGTLSPILGIGGMYLDYLIPAAALFYGDVVVFTSTVNTVDKTTTAAAYVAMAGVVVGGDLTDMRVMHKTRPAVGTAVCTSGKAVLVQINGVAWVVSDAAITAIGNRLMGGGTTAGRVATGTTATQIVGVALDAPGAAAGYMRMVIRQS